MSAWLARDSQERHTGKRLKSLGILWPRNFPSTMSPWFVRSEWMTLHPAAVNLREIHSKKPHGRIGSPWLVHVTSQWDQEIGNPALNPWISLPEKLALGNSTAAMRPMWNMLECFINQDSAIYSLTVLYSITTQYPYIWLYLQFILGIHNPPRPEVCTFGNTCAVFKTSF